MTSPPEPRPEVATDLVEYFVVVMPGPEALAEVVPRLVDLVDSASIRILDLVVVSVDGRGVPEIDSPRAVAELDAVRHLPSWEGVLLSHHDIQLVALALRPGDVAIVVVAEDRWAEPLATAARALGGEVRAGERIARDRVQAALAHSHQAPEEEDGASSPGP